MDLLVPAQDVLGNFIGYGGTGHGAQAETYNLVRLVVGGLGAAGGTRRSRRLDALSRPAAARRRRGDSAAIQAYLRLRRTLVSSPDSGAVFLTEHGRRWSKMSVCTFFNGINQRGGPEGRHPHPHLFRHSIAVQLLRGGADK